LALVFRLWLLLAIWLKQVIKVTIYEKNETVGGRARQLIKDGFTFDIGPTWYWMPDVFERFFADFNKKPQIITN
jgi:phytoene desaturase